MPGNTVDVLNCSIESLQLATLKIDQRLKTTSILSPEGRSISLWLFANFPSMLYHLQDTEAQSGTSIILEEYRPPIFLQIMQDSGMSSEYLSSIFRRTLKNHNYIRMIRQG